MSVNLYTFLGVCTTSDITNCACNMISWILFIGGGTTRGQFAGVLSHVINNCGKRGGAKNQKNIFLKSRDHQLSIDINIAMV